MRDFRKAIEEGTQIIRRHNRLDMSVPELNQLRDQFIDEGQTSEALMNVIIDAFRAGVAIGARNRK